MPQWSTDAEWIQVALHNTSSPSFVGVTRYPFGHILSPLARAAAARLRHSVDASVSGRLATSARQDLAGLLLNRLCTLCAAPLYDGFVDSSATYRDFVLRMQSGGLIDLFQEKPVLLRLVACLTRQWLNTSREFLLRLDADLPRMQHDLLRRDRDLQVIHLHGVDSDVHRGGRSVLRLEFADGSRVVYKPRNLELDAAWRGVIERLNHDAPLLLRAAAVASMGDYGWAEFIEHRPCDSERDCREFYCRAGAWLALLHCFGASDIHHENVIAAGSHPVPIDVETLLQGAVIRSTSPGSQAYEAAREMIARSVASVGMLPSYASTANGVRTAGGIASEWPTGKALMWQDMNADTMRPCVRSGAVPIPTNLPLLRPDRHIGLAGHVEDFVEGFRTYAAYLRDVGPRLFDGFAELDVRTVPRPTQFYSMLLQRLRDDRLMDDGVLWSSQADFVSRLSDPETASEETWSRQRSERRALLELNVPMFTSKTDGVRCGRDRLRSLSDREIAWQVEIIRQTSPDATAPTSDRPSGSWALIDHDQALPQSAFAREAAAVAEQIADHAVRECGGAAWVGVGWLPDIDASQLAVLGHDFYNGTCGIATFLAAYSAVTGDDRFAELASAALAHVRAEIGGPIAAHVARVMGIGGATGLGSIVYGLTCVSRLSADDGLLDDALRAARLMSDDLIATDVQLDVIGGSAGAILSLLCLHRETGEHEVLQRAVACGTHLLTQERRGPLGRRSWPSGNNSQVLNGISHGASGYAYAMSALAEAAHREDFAAAAAECLDVERYNFDGDRSDWLDPGLSEPHWRSQWCHGAVGIGLARLGIAEMGAPEMRGTVHTDIEAALRGASLAWPGHTDTLCCGALGSVELLRQASTTLGRDDLRQLASRRLSAVLRRKSVSGDYRWNAQVASRFNVGLFRGLAGIGYTCLREVDDSCPNVLIWA